MFENNPFNFPILSLVVFFPAIAALFDLAREINRLAPEDGDVGEAQETLRELAGVLGLSLEQDPAALAGAEPFLDLLVEMRQELRAARQQRHHFGGQSGVGLAEIHHAFVGLHSDPHRTLVFECH